MYFDWINRIGIFYIDYEWAEDIFYKLMSDIPRDAVELYQNGRNSMVIKLKDGSYIKFIPANDNSKGHKLNRIYYQDGVSDDVISKIIRPMWVSQPPIELKFD